MVGFKFCSGCGETYPKTEEYFRKNGNSWRSKCKGCINKNLPKKTEAEKKARRKETNKLWQEINRPRKTIKNNPIKICCTCKKELPRTDVFFRRRIERPNLFRSDCKECFDEKSKKRHIEFYKNNTEKEKARNHYFYYRDLDHTHKKHHKTYLKNIERVKEYDKKRIENLTDTVIRNNISNNTGLDRKLIPKEMIETKRLIIQLKREVKTKTTTDGKKKP